MEDNPEKKYSSEEVQKMIDGVKESLEKQSIALGCNISAATLEAFAKSVLDASITSNNAAARIGAEEMRSKIASMAMELAANLREKGNNPDAE